MVGKTRFTAQNAGGLGPPVFSALRRRQTTFIGCSAASGRQTWPSALCQILGPIGPSLWHAASRGSRAPCRKTRRRRTGNQHCPSCRSPDSWSDRTIALARGEPSSLVGYAQNAVVIAPGIQRAVRCGCPISRRANSAKGSASRSAATITSSPRSQTARQTREGDACSSAIGR